jgi:putative membrane protein
VKQGGIKMKYKLILSIVMVGMAVLFIIQNVTVVDMKFLFWTLSMSRALLMSLILSVGIILGCLLNSYFRGLKIVKSL